MPVSTISSWLTVMPTWVGTHDSSSAPNFALKAAALATPITHLNWSDTTVKSPAMLASIHGMEQASSLRKRSRRSDTSICSSASNSGSGVLVAPSTSPAVAIMFSAMRVTLARIKPRCAGSPSMGNNAFEHATLIVIPVTAKDIALPSAATLRQWADEAFKDMGGSKALFPMLGEPAQRGLILAKVTRMAENMIATAGLVEGATSTPDPLFEALEQMDVSERLDRFRKLLACSMPWIDANMAGDFTVVSDQFKCVIGVANAAAFKAKFGAELESCVPTQVGITVSQLEIVETGIRGRAVCYCELAGVPMTVLRGLEGWRTSYRKEGDNDKAPTHTHIDPTQFTHPIAPNTDEMKRLAEDFGEFLQAIMLGILTRHTGRVVPPGQYQFAVEPGDLRRIGNERAIRQNGMPASYEKNIALRIEEKLAALDAVQTAAMAALAKYYERGVYAPKLRSEE